MNIKFENIPRQMKEEGKFCLHENKIPKKRRYSKLYNASPNNKNDFSSYDSILRDYNSIKSDKIGVGIGIFDSLCGIDLDHCFKEGKPSQVAIDILKKMKSYTEKSLSGEGLHIFFKLKPEEQIEVNQMTHYIKMNEKQLQENGFKDTGGLELYQGTKDNRYLTLTGDKFLKIDEIREISKEELQDIIETYMKRPEKNISTTNQTFNQSSINYDKQDKTDEDFLNIGLEKDDELIRLWNETPSGSGGNESETDFSLLTKLAFWTNCNEALMIQAFESSPYFSRKDDKHQTKWNERKEYQLSRFWTNYNGETARARNIDFVNKQKEKELANQPEVLIAKQEQIIQEEQKKIDEITDLIENKNAMNIMSSFFETTDSGIYKPCPTGFKKLDEKTNGGISNQSIVILGGGTSVGKTTYILNLITNFANSRPIVYFTLEMSEEQILSKLYSHIAYKEQKMEISNSDILQSYDKNKMTEHRKKSLIQSIEAHEELKNIIVRFPSSSNINHIMKEIHSITEKIKEKTETAPIIVIDYLQFIQGETREDTQSLIKRIQRELKKYAIEENTIVFLLSANSREANKRKESSIDSGRDTSDIEYTSDYNLQLNFFEYEHGTDKKASVKQLSKANPRKMTITIHKQRFGIRGEMIDYNFNGKTNTFEEIQEDTPVYDDEEKTEEESNVLNWR